MLYVIATPIGNLEDISLRALKVLKEVDYVIAEDTRKTGNLLKHFNLPKKPFLSLHKFNERRQIKKIISLLKEGKNMALVSNAGTPAISDPGQRLIEEVRKENLEITSVPGACAAINALVLSGFSTEKFLFLGFLPKKKKRRIKELEEARKIEATIIIFESPLRIKRLLEELIEVFGTDVKVAIVREMTKIFEEVKISSAENLLKTLKSVKGEVVVVVENKK